MRLPFRRRASGDAVAVVVEGTPSGLGTFGGVFTPSILTILGVIMYLRFGWVVGNVGLLGTLVIVTLATSITFLTSLSIAAIATDQRVRAGGAYYMISRSLGIETGGAVGVPLFLAQALSIALYTIGFAESVALRFPGVDQKTIGLITTVAVAVLAIASAKTAIRAQYFIMAGIVLSLIALVFGHSIPPGSPTASAAILSEPRPSFWVVFAVFFPAVTGIMAGVNMSGDLRDPNRSIPIGTFAAVGTGYVVYMLLPLLLSARAPVADLLSDPLVMVRMSAWGDAIMIGVWGATLSSALGSVLGAPRILQALARDGVLPSRLAWLGKGSGADDSPRLGTALTLGLALAAVWFGDLNLIAPVLSMFFLTTYGVLNFSAGVERFLNSPSYRPTFKVHWAFSLLGFLGCVAVMLLINAVATAVAIAIVLGVYAWLESRSLHTAWGDVRRGMWMSLTRAGLLRVGTSEDSKNWRPNLLVLSGAPQNRWPLVKLASAITHNRSILTVATVLTTPDIVPERIMAMERNIYEYLADRAVQALVRVIKAPDPFIGAQWLVDSYGLGSMVPNTILLGNTDKPDHQPEFEATLKHFHANRRNAIIMRGTEEDFGARARIDVWWGGLTGNGGLMLLLAYLISTSLEWRGSVVRIQMVAKNETAANEMESNVGALLKKTRIGAELNVIVQDDFGFDEILRETSKDADLVMLGLPSPDDPDVFSSACEAMRDGGGDGPTTLFVLAAEDISFDEVLA